jgi:sulfur carrier protein ThiS
VLTRPKEERLSAEFSVTQILASLEAQMEFHREREAHHAEQEVVHREQRATHAAEYENVAKNYEAFKSTAGGAAEIAARTVVPAPAPAPEPREEPPQGPVKPRLFVDLVAWLVQELPAGEVFQASRVATEVNRRYPRQLSKPMDTPLASVCLRRLLRQGAVRLVKKGTAHHEALYTRAS